MAAVSLSADRIGTVAPATLKGWLHDGDEIALLDASEAGQFGEAHLFFAIPMPYSRLEIEAPRLLPRRGVRVVVYDDGNTDVAVRAARRLLDLGYDRVHILAGGAAGWSAAGFELFKGVNVPSKCFGELVEHAYHTPRITAQALAAMAERGEDFVVIDGRPFAEFQKMSIPGRDLLSERGARLSLPRIGAASGHQSRYQLRWPNPQHYRREIGRAHV